MPPMITTISAMSRYCVSLPLSTEIIVPPSTPPSPARNAPRKNAPAKTSWMLIPSAETICRSSTPARTIIPKRVRLITTQSASPTAIATSEHEDAEERIGERRRAWRLTLSGKHARRPRAPRAMPPKWASAWSAMMIEIAIVISACRSSWPWFQRRKTCCITSPMTPTASDATTSGTIQSARLASELPNADVGLAARHPLLQLEGEEAGEHVERAVGHVDDAHQPEDEREPARDDEVEAGEREPVEADDDEGPRIALRAL